MVGKPFVDTLRKFTAPEFVFGSGAASLVGAYISKFGVARVLLVTDPGVEAAGHATRAADRIREAGVACERFDAVSPNPRDSEVRTGAREYARHGCDAIVAVGGGSVMDCAKAIGLMAANDRDVLDLAGVDAVPLPGPPLVCVPTTAGTGADISQFAVINAVMRRTKLAIISKKAIPDVALIDPDTTVTMGAELTAATGMDALTHAIEAYVSTASSVVTDLHALESIRLVAEFLPRAVADGEDGEARNGMMLASLFAGLAFSNAGLGVVHALAHALGGELDLPHGLCNALLLESCIGFNLDHAAARYETVARALRDGFGPRKKGGADPGINPAHTEPYAPARADLLAALKNLRCEARLDRTLSDLGLSAGMLPSLAENAYRDACLATNPRYPSVSDLEAIYAEAL